jgi:diguanylate cyclase (GGDEF)-like protein
VLVFVRCLKVLVITLGLICVTAVGAVDAAAVDVLLDQASKWLFSAPEKAQAPLEQLRTLQPGFTPVQNERYQLYQASSLAFRGKHEERLTLVETFLPQVTAPAGRAVFLYQLIAANTALGRFDAALKAMNESILLLPRLEKTIDKISALQGAVTLLNALQAYDEALDFSQRIYALRSQQEHGAYAACIGLANQVEINFLRARSDVVRSVSGPAILACNANKNAIITLIVRTLVAIDLIDSGNYPAGLDTSLPLLKQYALLSDSSDYLSQLEDAVARAYLKKGNLERAEFYGLSAYQRAQAGKAFVLQEKTSNTMAAIKRARGQWAQAMAYYDINLACKKKLLDDQLQKNLAYQRVKFDTQDKANQLALLEQKNKTLSAEKELQRGRFQNLVLLLTLGLVFIAILGTWLIKTLRQKNVFRLSAQVDGLTQVSSREHFVTCAQQMFNGSEPSVSVLLLDMDHFKEINDRYGHATGDWVLTTVCNTVKSHLRKTDIVGRLGGEEFAVCLAQFSQDEVKVLAERCRIAIAAINTQPSGFEFQITASFGVATRGDKGLLKFEETLAAADKALYLSKNEGRNRVTVYQHVGGSV